MVLGVDEQESAHHDTLRDADDLAGMPVVVADLHSALPAVVAGARHAADLAGRPHPARRLRHDRRRRPARRVLPHRRHPARRPAGSPPPSPSARPSAATSRPSPCTPACSPPATSPSADLVVVAQGPGNLGTGTRWGFSGVAAGEAVNAVATLGGRPVASLRVSGADPRDRHLGVSHHSLTAYGRVALAAADVPVPAPTPDARGPARVGRRPHPPRRTSRPPTLAAPPPATASSTSPPTPPSLDALRGSPARLSTMGRDLDGDPASFVAAAVAGVHAPSSPRGTPRRPPDPIASAHGSPTAAVTPSRRAPRGRGARHRRRARRRHRHALARQLAPPVRPGTRTPATPRAPAARPARAPATSPSPPPTPSSPGSSSPSSWPVAVL